MLSYTNSSWRESEVLQAHQAARAGRTAPRPREALPRRLQACMQELLCVNERYHEALHEKDTLQGEVNMLRAEVEKLRVALSRSEAACEQQAQQIASILSTSETLREASTLQSVRTSTMEAQKGELQQLLEACMNQLKLQQKEIETLQGHVERAEVMKAEAFQAGFNDGMEQHQAEHASRLRQMRQSCEHQSEQAFHQGRQQAANEQSATQLREQAHRELLWHRAEEQRQKRSSLEQRLLRRPFSHSAHKSARSVARVRAPRG